MIDRTAWQNNCGTYPVHRNSYWVNLFVCCESQTSKLNVPNYVVQGCIRKEGMNQIFSLIWTLICVNNVMVDNEREKHSYSVENPCPELLFHITVRW